MRLGLYQCPSPAGDPAAALKVIETALTEAATAGVDLLTMPEVFLPGYNSQIAPPPEGYGQALSALPALVSRHQVALNVGLAEYGDKTLNSAFVYGRDGEMIATYRKVQLWGDRESALYAPGEALTLFNFEGRTFGLLICYDVEFPEHTRALARAGAEAVLVPTANMQPFTNVNEVTVPARALESGLTIVYANYCGTEGDLTYTGRSLIAGPDGRPLAKMGEETGLIWADLPVLDDPTLEAPTSTQFADLRPITTIQMGTGE